MNIMFKREASESPLCQEPIAYKLCYYVPHIGEIDVFLDTVASRTVSTRRMHLRKRLIRFGIIENMNGT